tara:strand:- start:60047 stop:60250 length:204 start_codon:yes stop_codon:yes gene_type:complete
VAIKKVDTPPKDGTQFVAMWVFGSGLWSECCRYNEQGYLEMFSAENDDFETGALLPQNVEITYYIDN